MTGKGDVVMPVGKYGNLYPSARENLWYRYDYEHGVLECVTKCDCYTDSGGSLINLLFMNWVVVFSVKLSQADWELSPLYWVGYYSGEIKEEDRTFEFKRGNRWNIPKLKIVG